MNHFFCLFQLQLSYSSSCRWNMLHMHSQPCLSASEQAFLFFRT